MTSKAMRDGTMSLGVGSSEFKVTLLDDIVLFQDRLVFWGGLVLHPLAWGLFFVMNAITLDIFKV